MEFLGYEPKSRTIILRKRMKTWEKIEDEEEIEILRGEETKTWEDVTL